MFPSSLLKPVTKFILPWRISETTVQTFNRDVIIKLSNLDLYYLLSFMQRETEMLRYNTKQVFIRLVVLIDIVLKNRLWVCECVSVCVCECVSVCVCACVCVCVFEHVWAFIYGFGIDFCGWHSTVISRSNHKSQKESPKSKAKTKMWKVTILNPGKRKWLRDLRSKRH